jgi:hypothetical protein
VHSVTDAVARVRIASWVEDDDTVAGLREALLSWGPDTGLVADAALAIDRALDAMVLLQSGTPAQTRLGSVSRLSPSSGDRMRHSPSSTRCQSPMPTPLGLVFSFECAAPMTPTHF